jgi:hypothetical protein
MIVGFAPKILNLYYILLFQAKEISRKAMSKSYLEMADILNAK